MQSGGTTSFQGILESAPSLPRFLHELNAGAASFVEVLACRNSSTRKWRHCKFLHSVRPSPSVPRNTQITMVSSLKDLLLSAPFCTADGHTASNAPDLFLVGVLFQLKVHWQTASRRCDKVYDRITQRQDHFIPSGTRSAQVFRVSVEHHTVALSSNSSFPQRVTSTTTGCCTVRLVRDGSWTLGFL